jgi:hypothetical protein
MSRGLGAMRSYLSFVLDGAPRCGAGLATGFGDEAR